jgi:hypothetical protein
MGPTVLAAAVHGQTPAPDPRGPLKSYAHCTRLAGGAEEAGGAIAAAGAVTLLLINLATDTNVSATLPVGGGGGGGGPHTLYRLQAAGEDEGSHSVQLNGKRLELGEGGALPDMPGLHRASGETVELAPLDIVFAVLPAAHAAACAGA